MYRIKFLILGLFFIVSCSDKSSFVIKGKIIGGEGIDKVVLSYTKGELMVKDTATLLNSEFIFKGKIAEPTLAFLDICDDSFWLESGTMTIVVDKENKKLEVEGSETQKVSDKYYAAVDSMVSIFNSEAGRIRQLNENLKKAVSDIEKSEIKDEIERAGETLKNMERQSHSLPVNFARENPSSVFSAFLLYPINSNEKMDIDTCMTIFQSFDDKVKNSYWGKKISKDLDLRNNNRIGGTAPDFTAFDEIGKREVSLSSLKGKVVILDFWAPWCKPCRWGLAKLKKLYEKYHDDGLEVIAIYSERNNNDKGNRDKAVLEDDMPKDWYFVDIASDMDPGKETPEDIRSKYYVSAIPRRIIIDKEGKIAKITIGVSEEIEKDIEKTVAVLLK